MVIYLTTFMIAFISTILVGAVTKIIVDLFAESDTTGRVSAVAVAAGFSIQNVQYSGPADLAALTALMGAIGSLIALAALWFRLIKRASMAGEKKTR